MKIKEIFKRFLPPTSKRFTDEIYSLKKEFEKQKSDIQKLLQLKAELKDLPDYPIYWENEFEKRIVLKNWGSVKELPDFEEKYFRLIAGMDEASITIINRIISRQDVYLHTDNKKCSLFTREEQKQIRELHENFHREIFQISDNLYSYRKYFLPVNHFESSVFYFRHGIDELRTKERVNGRVILDVGGFIGDSVLVLSELNPCDIYTFEADPDNFNLLQKTLEINHIKNAIPINSALGDHCGTCSFQRSGAMSSIVPREGVKYTEEIEVSMTTLDEFVSTHPMNIGLIKVDIEGGEPNFLEGAKKTICEQKPILLISIYHNAHDFFEIKPMIEKWGLGYHFSIHKPTNGNATSETLLICECL